MTLRTLALAATFALTAAAPALAAGSVSATLQSPVAAKTKIVAGGAVFNCIDATCIAATPTARTLTAATCKQLVKEVGALAAFGNGKRELDVARCNGAATAAGAN